jgi:hypothetical protein
MCSLKTQPDEIPWVLKISLTLTWVMTWETHCSGDFITCQLIPNLLYFYTSCLQTSHMWKRSEAHRNSSFFSQHLSWLHRWRENVYDINSKQYSIENCNTAILFIFKLWHIGFYVWIKFRLYDNYNIIFYISLWLVLLSLFWGLKYAKHAFYHWSTPQAL